MSFFDFCIPLLIKLPVVLTPNLIPLLLFVSIFILLKLFHYPIAAAYFGEMVFFAVGLFLIYAAFKFNSKFVLRRIARNNSESNPLFIYPHPLIRSVTDSDTPRIRIRKRIAIALIELKAYTFANGFYFIIMYFLFLIYMHSVFPNAIRCTSDCQIYRYGMKSLGSGILFDFFDAFDIPVSNITAADVSPAVRIMSFVAKLVLVGLVIHVVAYYFTLKRRFKSELRVEALTQDEAKTELAALRKGRTIPRINYKLVILPPWLSRKNK